MIPAENHCAGHLPGQFTAILAVSCWFAFRLVVLACGLLCFGCQPASKPEATDIATGTGQSAAHLLDTVTAPMLFINDGYACLMTKAAAPRRLLKADKASFMDSPRFVLLHTKTGTLVYDVATQTTHEASEQELARTSPYLQRLENARRALTGNYSVALNQIDVDSTGNLVLFSHEELDLSTPLMPPSEEKSLGKTGVIVHNRDYADFEWLFVEEERPWKKEGDTWQQVNKKTFFHVKLAPSLKHLLFTKVQGAGPVHSDVCLADIGPSFYKDMSVKFRVLLPDAPRILSVGWIDASRVFIEFMDKDCKIAGNVGGTNGVAALGVTALDPDVLPPDRFASFLSADKIMIYDIGADAQVILDGHGLQVYRE